MDTAIVQSPKQRDNGMKIISAENKTKEMSYMDHLNRCILALRFDPESLSSQDRHWMAEFIDTNKDQDIPKNQWLVFMTDYYHSTQEPVEPTEEEMCERQATTRQWLIEEQDYTPQSLWPAWYAPGTPKPD